MTISIDSLGNYVTLASAVWGLLKGDFSPETLVDSANPDAAVLDAIEGLRVEIAGIEGALSQEGIAIRNLLIADDTADATTALDLLGKRDENDHSDHAYDLWRSTVVEKSISAFNGVHEKTVSLLGYDAGTGSIDVPASTTPADIQLALSAMAYVTGHRLLVAEEPEPGGHRGDVRTHVEKAADIFEVADRAFRDSLDLSSSFEYVDGHSLDDYYSGTPWWQGTPLAFLGLFEFAFDIPRWGQETQYKITFTADPSIDLLGALEDLLISHHDALEQTAEGVVLTLDQDSAIAFDHHQINMDLGVWNHAVSPYIDSAEDARHVQTYLEDALEEYFVHAFGMDPQSVTPEQSETLKDAGISASGDAMDHGDFADALRDLVKGSEQIGDDRDNQLFGDRNYDEQGRFTPVFDADDLLIGEGGQDLLDGMTGDDVLMGGDGDDILNGGAGSDELHGDAGRDLLEGGADNDLIDGGLGSDRLSGKSGADVFVFVAQADTQTDQSEARAEAAFAAGDYGIDEILDFEKGVDKIALNVSVFEALSGWKNPDEAGHSQNADLVADHLIQDGRTLSYDADGDGPEDAIAFAILPNAVQLTHDDFLVI